MGLNANALFFYGVEITPNDVGELRLRDEREGRRNCPECGAWVSTPFCPNDGATTIVMPPKIGFNYLRLWGDECAEEVADHRPHSMDLALHYIHETWSQPFYLYLLESRVEAGSLRGGLDDNMPKAMDVVKLTQGFDFDGADKKLEDGCRFLDIEFNEDTAQFYLAMYMGW